jgi:hypothetical protein
MLKTPYINTYYYKTELFFNQEIELIRKKAKDKITKQTETTDSKVTSLGIAFSIGLLGAVVAFKNKIFD